MHYGIHHNEIRYFAITKVDLSDNISSDYRDYLPLPWKVTDSVTGLKIESGHSY